MRLFYCTVILLSGLALGGCTIGGKHHSDATDVLTGDVWVVEDIGGHGLLDDTRATMLFSQKGRLTGNTSCNNYFAAFNTDGMTLQIESVGTTRKSCVAAIMDQESHFLNLLSSVSRYHIDSAGVLILSTPASTAITARRATAATLKVTYRCPDNSIIEAWYPTTDTARILYQGRSFEMTSVISASGARYVGGGWQWWTKGMTEGLLSPLATGESIASARGMTCTTQ